MQVKKCEVCGATSDEKPDRSTYPFEPYEWRTLVVRRREGWSSMSGTTDTWPGSHRWQEDWVPVPDLALDFCTAECLEEGARRLHEGSQLVGWSGFTMPVATLAVAKAVIAQVAAMQEP